MGDKSGIEWTDATWNWVVGCTPVSAGCDHCYAKTLHDRHHTAWLGGNYPTAPKQYHEPFDKVQAIPERLSMPLRWQWPRKIFVNSLADVFHKDVPDDLIDRALAVMALADKHTFQILTKRPQRMQRYLSDPGLHARVLEAAKVIAAEMGPAWLRREGWLHIDRDPGRGFVPRFPLPNVWLGVSVEQQAAAWRIDWLVKTPAAVRFLSVEPLIGSLDLSRWLLAVDIAPDHGIVPVEPRIDWVIVGGESGAGHRPIDPDWVRLLRDQCVEAEVAFMMKQWGGRTAKAGGRELDGRTWDEFPEIGGGA